jgi:lysyl-tRNA synthetase class 2
LSDDWRPTADVVTLRRRAAMLDATRRFFRDRNVLEVETPVVLSHTVTDVQLESLQLAANPPRFLQTSPEYPMKRLLAAGSGDIFQICHAFRAGDRSRLHNPEFTMIEWYRLGFDLQSIMSETALLAGHLLQCAGQATRPVEFIGYNEAFLRELGIDALDASQDALAAHSASCGLALQSIAGASRDDLLDFLVATRVGPRLGQGTLTCLHHFPASQASLAQLETGDPRTALRFELYADGMELANGYVELASSVEQQQRFAADQEERKRRGLSQPDMDPRLLAALGHGLPACAGVAMGFDRVAMLALGAPDIDAVMPFPWERA